MGGKTTEGMNPATAAKVNALVAASGGRVWINSGYRSVERQKQLFDAAVKKYGSVAAARKYVAPPGKSQHNHGNAVDFGGDLKWVAANAARFGLHQPMSWEPWHFEGAERSDSTGSTTPPEAGHVHGPGDPDTLDELAGKKREWGTIEGQLANLMAAISTPTERVF